MNHITIEELISIFSRPRLKDYFLYDVDSKGIIKQYNDNLLLCESLLPALHYFEILLRNKLNSYLSIYYGQDWLIDISKIVELKQDAQKIIKLSESVRNRYNRKSTQDDILAATNLGFWCSFFHKKYDTILWHRKDAFRFVFPNLQRAYRTRKFVESNVLKIKEVRNRIAHHNLNTRKINVYEIHKHMLQLIYAMSPEAAHMLIKIDRFPILAEQFEIKKHSFIVEMV